jgi:putative transposase
MEAFSSRKKIQEVASDHAIHPIQVSQWKRQLLDGARELFFLGITSSLENLDNLLINHC